MKDFFFLLIGIAFIGGCIYLFLQKPVPDKYKLNLETRFPKTLQIDNTVFQIEIADTNEKRVQGLSGRESLADPRYAEGSDEARGSGMLFIFNEPGLHGIWMKDMKFPIDIAWIDSQKTVFWVEKNVSPDTFPKVFYPPTNVLYVLEVPAGTFEKNNIDIGETVYWTD